MHDDHRPGGASGRVGFALLAALLLVLTVNYWQLAGWTVHHPGVDALVGGLPVLMLAALFGVAFVACVRKTLGKSALSPWLLLGLSLAVWRGTLLLGL